MALYAVHTPRLETKGRELGKGECIQKAMRSGDRHEDREEEERAERRRRAGGQGIRRARAGTGLIRSATAGF